MSPAITGLRNWHEAGNPLHFRLDSLVPQEHRRRRRGGTDGQVAAKPLLDRRQVERVDYPISGNVGEDAVPGGAVVGPSSQGTLHFCHVERVDTPVTRCVAGQDIEPEVKRAAGGTVATWVSVGAVGSLTVE